MAPNNKVNIMAVAISLMLIAYVVYCIAHGQISARVLGAKERPILRSEQPFLFWFVIVGHMTVALIMIFAL